MCAKTVEGHTETWRVERVKYPTAARSSRAFAFIEADGVTIAELYGPVSNDGIDTPVAARANVMAAAPQMLAALKAVLSRDTSENWQAMRAAVEQAEGRAS